MAPLRNSESSDSPAATGWRGRVGYNEALSRPYRTPTAAHWWQAVGEEMRRNHTAISVRYSIGVAGYYAGPDVHIVDPFALADPFLARLPARHDRKLRVGHYERELPQGYLDTLRAGTCTMTQSRCALYEQVRIVTQAPLFDSKRLRLLPAMLLAQGSR